MASKYIKRSKSRHHSASYVGPWPPNMLKIAAITHLGGMIFQGTQTVKLLCSITLLASHSLRYSSFEKKLIRIKQFY